ncbi:Cadherin domain protein, partial [Trichostrongylus colubriformis]
VNKALDFEKTRNYTFTVAAMDYGTPQMQSLQQVTVHIVDVNDHAPVLRSSSASVEIDEVTPRGTSILQFEVDDGDCIENAASVFAIEEGYGVFDVSPTSGELYVNSPLDFESQSLYNITVSARNIAGGAKSYRSVIVHVKDSNDERPRFVGGSPVQFPVYENLPGPFPAVIGSTISEVGKKDKVFTI